MTPAPLITAAALAALQAELTDSATISVSLTATLTVSFDPSETTPQQLLLAATPAFCSSKPGCTVSIGSRRRLAAGSTMVLTVEQIFVLGRDDVAAFDPAADIGASSIQVTSVTTRLTISLDTGDCRDVTALLALARAVDVGARATLDVVCIDPSEGPGLWLLFLLALLLIPLLFGVYVRLRYTGNGASYLHWRFSHSNPRVMFGYVSGEYREDLWAKAVSGRTPTVPVDLKSQEKQTATEAIPSRI